MFTKAKFSFVLRFTDEISDLKEKRPPQESHTPVGRFIVELSPFFKLYKKPFHHSNSPDHLFQLRFNYSV